MLIISSVLRMTVLSKSKPLVKDKDKDIEEDKNKDASFSERWMEMEELLCGRYRGVIRDEMASTSISPISLSLQCCNSKLHCCSVATLHCALGTTVDQSGHQGACYSVTVH